MIKNVPFVETYCGLSCSCCYFYCHCHRSYCYCFQKKKHVSFAKLWRSFTREKIHKKNHNSFTKMFAFHIKISSKNLVRFRFNKILLFHWNIYIYVCVYVSASIFCLATPYSSTAISISV